MALGPKTKMAVLENASNKVVDQTRSYQARQKIKVWLRLPQRPEPRKTVLAMASNRLPDQTEVPVIRTLCLVTVI
jgi:hypothetical protein